MKREIKTACMFLLFALICLLVSWLFTGTVEVTLYGLEICAFLYVLLFLGRFAAQRRKCRMVKEVRFAKGGTVDLEAVAPESCLEEEYRKTIYVLKEEMDRIYLEKHQKERENNEYYTMWIHQIKTPIAAMRLLIRSQEQGEKRRKMEQQLFEIERYAQMALHYLHIQEAGNDFILKEYELSDIVKSAVRKYSVSFIEKKLTMDFKEFSFRVVTDEKWLEILLEQLISNSVKYTKQGSVTISFQEEEKDLVITDTGIGILAEDLPRIFEKGFTGFNGHMDRQSTGIGLYLCRQIAEKLGIVLTVESQINKGTSFHVQFLTKMKD